MLTYFYKMDSAWQIFLLVLSQFTVFLFVAGIVFLYRRGCKLLRLSGVVLAFLINAVVYVCLQLDSRITLSTPDVHLHIPYTVLLLVVSFSLAYIVWVLIGETKGKKTISRGSIKEAFDNLPTGVCFFNDEGIPVLCNLAMQRFSFSVCGKDVQYITELEGCLLDDFVPVSGVRKVGKTFVLPSGAAWRLKKRVITHESGNSYTQYIAADVTNLYKKREELIRENEQLRKVQEDLRRLSANVVAITREEEILNTKMRVHDEMGRCLIAAQKYLKEENKEPIPDSIAASWQRAVAMIKYNNETQDEDMSCRFVKPVRL